MYSSVTLYSIDKHAIYATVSYANRDVGLEVLKMGLGWYVPWSGAKTPLAEVFTIVRVFVCSIFVSAYGFRSYTCILSHMLLRALLLLLLG